MTEPQATYTAFSGDRLVGGGYRGSIIASIKQNTAIDANSVVIFEDATGRQVDFDLSGTVDEAIDRDSASRRIGPGRPKLGVVGREVSLLPRHWDWLEEQPNGISAAIRRLVDEARKREPGAQRARRMRNALSRIMWAMAGDRENFEEATRALFTPDDQLLAELVASWPTDVRDHILQRAVEASRAEES